MEMETKTGQITINNPKGGDPKVFTFDAIYDWNSKQIDIYDETARPIVQAVLEGFNGTIFAYGQTGTGKTFTMEGKRSVPELRGIIPTSFEHIFREISDAKEGQQYLVRASYLEIYKEEIRDLLSKSQKHNLPLKEKPDSGVYVKDLSSFVVKSVKEIEHVMNVGNKNRSVGATNMNIDSSRSHAIFLVTVECSELGADGESHIRVGKLNLVDLAGSERQSKTQASGERQAEGIKINQSLSCLGNVICALVEGGGRTHVPYRDSKLTRLLMDSLGGNAKTVMIANIGPADYNFDESVNTLRYANRAKSIKNKPKINEDPKDALLREFQDQIAQLKAQLEKKGGGGGGKRKEKKDKKKKIIINEYGEEQEVTDDDDDDDDEDAKEAEKAIYDEERAKLEEERQAMLENQSLTQQEKDRLEEGIAAREEQLEKEKRVAAELAAKIKAMEGKLLGPNNVIDRTSEQERELERRRREVAERKEREREMKRELEEREEKRLEAQETFTSKQQEAELKTKKLRKIYGKLEDAKQEIDDLEEEFARQREELLQTTADLQRELKLRQMIIEHFIPKEEVSKINGRAVFDVEYDQWRLVPLAEQEVLKRPISAVPGSRHAITQDAKVRSKFDRNPRYRPENVYLVELEMPDRTTKDYVGPMVDPRVQAALDDALRDEDDITIEATPDDFLAAGIQNARRRKKSLSRSKR